VQFPAETVATETQLDAFVVHREIARAGKISVPEFRPVNLAR
jgi:hypothetical protein